MSKHNNPSISERARKIFNNLGNNEVSNELGEIIQPTIEIAPYISVVKSGLAENSTSFTIYTTPADQDFYLYGIVLSVIKDVTATSTVSYVSSKINTITQTLVGIAGLTLTPQNQSISLFFPRPIKLDRNATITLNNTTAVANVSSRAYIYGYIEEIKNPAQN